MSRMKFSTRRRVPADLVRAAHGPLPFEPAESLEPRVHLAAYTAQTFHELFDVSPALHTIVAPEDAAAAGFGATGAGLGDLDGDGRGEFAISAPGGGDVGGRVFIYSGATGQIIRTLEDGSAEFGVSLANVGDVDADGVADLLVGSPLHGGTGAARVYSGADGSVLREFAGPSAGAEFGRVVALLADGSPAPLIAVGAPGAGPEGEGQVFIITTAQILPLMPGAEIVYVLTGEGAGDRFGAALTTTAGAAVLAEGEAPDLFIGAPLNDAAGEDAGRAYLYNGEDGSLLLTLTGQVAGDHFGEAVGARWWDSQTQLVVGSPLHDYTPAGFPAIVDSGRIDFFKLDGESVFSFPLWGAEGERMGARINPVGKITGDDFTDLVWTASGATGERRMQYLLSGIGGGPTLNESPAAVAVFSAGDVNGDGVDDIVFISGGDGTGAGADTATVVSSLLRFGGGAITGASDDLSFVFISGTNDGIFRNYAFIDGELVPLRLVPGVGPDGVVLAVNNAGVIVGRLEVEGQFGSVRLGTPFVVIDGTRTLLPDLVTQIVGAGEVTPVWDRMRPVRIAEDGTIIFNEATGPQDESAQSRSWLYRDGVLTFLWDGPVVDINNAGQVIGSLTDNMATPVLRQADGTIVQLTGLASATAIADTGAVAGVSSSGALAVWRDGVVTELVEAPSPANFWRPVDIDDEGRVLARQTVIQGRGTFVSHHIFIPGQAEQNVLGVLFGPAGPYGEYLGLADGGRILTSGGVLQPLDEAVVWSLAETSPVATVINGATTSVIGVNPLGDVILIQDTAGVVSASRLSFGIVGVPTEIIAYVDPKDGATYAVLLSGGKVTVGRIHDGGTFSGLAISDIPGMAPAIVDNASVFFSADRRVLIAGTDATGDLILYYQAGLIPTTGEYFWGSSNLTQAHIAARGQTFVPVASAVAGFSTRWGTDHVAYLDEEGRVQIVWWAPGDDLWRIDALTTVEGSGVLTGTPTAFVTPWDTLHINAFDAEGRTVAVWWAPGFGGEWRTDVLVADAGAPRLAPLSATSFVTPWEALNIVGLDAQTGEVTVYWWAPATNVWAAERVIAAGSEEGAVLTGRPAAAAGVGSQTIVGRGADGKIVRLLWLPETGWTVGDLTLAVSSAS